MTIGEQALSKEIHMGKVGHLLGLLSANESWAHTPGPPGCRQVSGSQALSGPALASAHSFSPDPEAPAP